MKIGAATERLRFPEDFFPTEGFSVQLDALHARVLVMEGRERHAMLVLEMTSIPPEEIETLQGILREATGAARAYVLATHTFSAPHFLPDHALTDEAQREKKKALEALVYHAVRSAAESAAISMKEAQMFIGTSECAVATARDVLTPDGWWVGNNGTGPVDRRMTAVRFANMEGKTIAALVHYAVQSSVLDGSQLRQGGKAVSGDLAGLMAETLEREWNAPVFFLIGAAGDQAPREKAVSTWFENGVRTENDLQDDAIGLCGLQAEEMAQSARSALSNALPCESETLVHRSIRVALPGKRINRNLRELHPTKNPPYEADGVNEQEIELLQLGALKLLGVKPELNCVTAQQISSIDSMVRVVTLWNGGAKYLADMRSCERITYEAQNSPFYPGAAEKLVSAAVSLLQDS